MKKFVIITIISVVTLIVLVKFIRSPEPLTPSRLSALESNKEYESFARNPDTKTHNYKPERRRDEGLDKTTGLTNQKLRMFAKAFIEVQSYMDIVGNKVDYKETTKIVRRNGLSVKDYTSIATLTNKNTAFREKVQKLIYEIKDSNY